MSARTPEGKIRDYLKARIEALGGETRAIKYIGRNHCPDVLVMVPMHEPEDVCLPIRSAWRGLVETKAPGKTPNAGQLREHTRLRKLGMKVLVLSTKEQIDREFPPP